MGLYATFNSTEELRTEFSHHLDIEMNHARYRWLPAPGNLSGVAKVDLSEDARRLLKAAVASSDGYVVLFCTRLVL
jgi:hypothetical protein